MKLTTFGWLGVLALGLASTPIACFDSHAPACTVDCQSSADCPSGLACSPNNKCSAGGEMCDDTNTPCEVGAVRCTSGGTAVETCDGDAMWTIGDTCAASCFGAPAHCGHIVPTFAALKTICDDKATTSRRSFAENKMIDTTNPLDCDMTLAQVGGPSICVIRASTINVETGALVTTTGANALAFVADGDVAIAGTVDVSAAANFDGPGGGGNMRESGDGSATRFGGGGAGFRTSGADGGAAADGQGMLGGVMAADPTSSTVLVGGFRAKTAAAMSTSGGGGGGALAVISCGGTVRIDAVINAGGGGGNPGGDYGVGDYRSGAGGGSGGLISIQALDVTIGANGSLFANGGAGGGGHTTQSALGMIGEDGSTSSMVGARGGTAGGTGGKGGDGACVGKPPLPGKGDPTNTRSAGGGGGSMGYSILYTPTGSAAITTTNPPSPAVNLAVVPVR